MENVCTRSPFMVIYNYLLNNFKHYSYCLHPQSALFLHKQK